MRNSICRQVPIGEILIHNYISLCYNGICSLRPELVYHVFCLILIPELKDVVDILNNVVFVLRPV